MNTYRLLVLMITSAAFGCTATPSTGYYRQCGTNKNNPQGTKIIFSSVRMQSLPIEKTFYVADKEGGYMILLRPNDLLRYLEHYQDSIQLLEQIKSELPLQDFTDLNKFRLTSMLHLSENSISWAQMLSIAEMLENGDATIVDVENDRGRHGLIRKLTVAHIENQYGKWREFCINDDDHLNNGWPIYRVADEIVD